MPVDPIPIIAHVTIRGWPADNVGTDDPDSDPLLFHVAWTSGYTKPLLVDFSSGQFTKVRWERLRSLDLAVDFGPDGLDWEFCVDDLVVGFMPRRELLTGGNGEKDARRQQKEIVDADELRDVCIQSSVIGSPARK